MRKKTKSRKRKFGIASIPAAGRPSRISVLNLMYGDKMILNGGKDGTIIGVTGYAKAKKDWKKQAVSKVVVVVQTANKEKVFSKEYAPEDKIVIRETRDSYRDRVAQKRSYGSPKNGIIGIHAYGH